jgi:hypothetical protein
LVKPLIVTRGVFSPWLGVLTPTSWAAQVPAPKARDDRRSGAFTFYIRTPISSKLSKILTISWTFDTNKIKLKLLFHFAGSKLAIRPRQGDLDSVSLGTDFQSNRLGFLLSKPQAFQGKIDLFLQQGNRTRTRGEK